MAETLIRLPFCLAAVVFILLAAWQVQHGKVGWVVFDVVMATIFLFAAVSVESSL